MLQNILVYSTLSETCHSLLMTSFNTSLRMQESVRSFVYFENVSHFKLRKIMHKKGGSYDDLNTVH